MSPVLACVMVASAARAAATPLDPRPSVASDSRSLRSGDHHDARLDLHFDPHFDVVNGGKPGERLVGTSRTDRVYGHGGPDTLIGRRADDWLAGGRGDDRLRPGKGADMVTCGPGADLVLLAQRDDLIDSTCEQVYYHQNPHR